MFLREELRFDEGQWRERAAGQDDGMASIQDLKAPFSYNT